MLREIGCLLAAAVLLVNLWLLWEFVPGFLAWGVALLVLGGVAAVLLGDPEAKRQEAEEDRMWRKLEELEAADDKETVYHACLLRRRLEADGIGEDEFVRLSQEVEARWESERRTVARGRWAAMSTPRNIPFVRDDGGQADAGIVSTLSAVQLSVVRAVAIVTGAPFADVHARGMLFATADHETLAGLLTGAYGLDETTALEDCSMRRARKLSRKRGVRRLVLRVSIPHYHYCAIVRGKLRDTEPLPSEDPDECKIDTAWIRTEDADNVDEPEDEDPGPLID